MSLLSRLCAIAGAFGLLTLIALAPSAALAHAGHHHHGGMAETRGQVEAPRNAASSEVARQTERSVQELRSAGLTAPDTQQDRACGDRGCCNSGHCAGCVNAIAPAPLVEFSPSAKLRCQQFNAATPAGIGTDGPSRPPKTFA